MLKEVLTFLIRPDGRVLLAQKSSKAKVAWNKWNGYGGGIENDEIPESAAVREIDEETDHGLEVWEGNLESRGSVIFFNPPGRSDRIVYLFVCRRFSGEPKETGEMRNPTWFNPEDIGTLDMMPADKFFIPQILKGKSVKKGWVRFKEGYKGIEDSHFEFEDA